MQKFSIHTHTNFSDGYNSPEEMIIKAKELGLDFYGVSDHLTIHPNLDLFESFNRYYFEGQIEAWEEHYEKIRYIAKELNFEVKCGIEVDFINDDNWMKEFEEFKRQLSYDYLITGTHCMYLDIKDNIYCIGNHLLTKMSDKEKLKLAKNYWDNIKAAVGTGWFDLVAHLDLIKKFDFLNIDCDEKFELIDLLINKRQPIELNTKMIRITGDYAPSDKILKRFISNNHPICLSDDAHKIKDICFDFDNAKSHLISLGHKNWWKPKF